MNDYLKTPGEGGARPADPPSPAVAQGKSDLHRPRRNRAWIWYFLIIFALAVLAIVILGVFRFNQPVTPERLAKARELWERNGPRNYDMKYERRLRDEPRGDTFEVRVRNGMVVSVLMNGKATLRPDQYQDHSMTALFDYLEDFLTKDKQKEALRVSARASFHPENGGLRQYHRRVQSADEGVMIVVRELKEVSAEGPDGQR